MAFGKGVSLVVNITGDTKGLSDSLGKAGGDVSTFGSGLLGTAAKVSVVGGVVVAAGAAIWEMADAAASDRAEQDKLATAISAAGAATKDTNKQVDAAIALGQDKAFTDSETRDALQSLVTSTKDVGKATALLTEAQDIARLSGVDLATAADAVAKANSGNDGSLRKLIPGLKKGKTATDTLAEATKLARGQADKFAASTDGMKARAGDAFGELSETIGEVFLPIVDEIVPALIPILKAIGTLVKSLLPFLIPLIKILAQALGIALRVLVRVVDAVSDLVRWIGKVLSPLSRLIDRLQDLNPFKNFSLPFLNGLSVATAGSVSGLQAGTQSASGGGSHGGVTINIYGDPAVIEAKVIRALRSYQKRNGIGSVFSPGRV